jgi:hypothetical protein
MSYREIIAVFSEIRTEHINTPCGQNVEILSFKCGGLYSNQGALEWKATSHYPPIYILNFSENFTRQTHLKHKKKCTFTLLRILSAVIKYPTCLSPKANHSRKEKERTERNEEVKKQKW